MKYIASNERNVASRYTDSAGVQTIGIAHQQHRKPSFRQTRSENCLLGNSHRSSDAINKQSLACHFTKRISCISLKQRTSLPRKGTKYSFRSYRRAARSPILTYRATTKPTASANRCWRNALVYGANKRVWRSRLTKRSNVPRQDAIQTSHSWQAALIRRFNKQVVAEPTTRTTALDYPSCNTRKRTNYSNAPTDVPIKMPRE